MGRDETYRPAMLSALVRDGMGVRCWCARCRRHTVLPSPELLARIGRDVSVPSLTAWLRCQQCGGEPAVMPDWPKIGCITS